MDLCKIPTWNGRIIYLNGLNGWKWKEITKVFCE